MTWSLRLPTVPPSGNVIMHMPWVQYHKLLTDWFNRIRGAENFLQIPRAQGKRKVTVIRHSHHILDDDNLAFSTKTIFDVLRPHRVMEGIYKSGPRKGEPHRSVRIGHGFILDDDPSHVIRDVRNGKLKKGEKPYILIIIEEMA